MTKKNKTFLEWDRFNQAHRLLEVTKGSKVTSIKLVAEVYERKTQGLGKLFMLYNYVEGFRSHKRDCTIEEAKKCAEDFHRENYLKS